MEKLTKATNRMFYVLIMFVAVSFGFGVSPWVKADTPITEELLLVCDSVKNDLRCQDVTFSYLEQLSQQIFGDEVVEPCHEACPIAPKVPDLGVNAPSLIVNYIVISAHNAVVNRFLVERTLSLGASNYLASKANIQAKDEALAELIYELEIELKQIEAALVFTQDTESGVFYNTDGETLVDLGFVFPHRHYPKNVTKEELTRLGNCTTAYSWIINEQTDTSLPGCHSFLRNQIETMAENSINNRGLWSHFVNKLTKWQLTVSIFGLFNLTPPSNPDSFSLTFHFKDGSKLVLETTFTQALNELFATTLINEEKSKSSDGISLAELHNNLRLPTGSGHGDVSFQEANAFFGSFNCSTILTTLGVTQRFRVEVLDYDQHGRPNHVKIHLIEQSYDNVENIICTRF